MYPHTHDRFQCRLLFRRVRVWHAQWRRNEANDTILHRAHLGLLQRTSSLGAMGKSVGCREAEKLLGPQ
jgi:hypothetical protein